MDKVGVINIWKWYSDEKTERVIKLPAFLFSAAIWSHLAHSWPSLSYVCTVIYKTLGQR